MRELRRLALTAVVVAAAAAPAFGQGGAGGAGGAGSTGSTGGAGGQSLGNSNQSSLGGTQIAQQQQAPSLALSTTGAASTNRTISTTNLFQQFYANPYYQGTYTNNKNNIVPGGFGQPSFGTSTGGGTTARGGTLGGQVGFGATGMTGGSSGGVVAPSASTGGRGGGAGGAGGAGGVNLADPGGQIAPLARQIAYPAVIRFQPPPIVTTAVQTELRSMIDRSPSVANPAAVQVAMADGGTVVLRGAVRDVDEAQTIEGMIRLTPGVRSVRNEMTYPKP